MPLNSKLQKIVDEMGHARTVEYGGYCDHEHYISGRETRHWREKAQQTSGVSQIRMIGNILARVSSKFSTLHKLSKASAFLGRFARVIEIRPPQILFRRRPI